MSSLLELYGIKVALVFFRQLGFALFLFFFFFQKLEKSNSHSYTGSKGHKEGKS